MVHDMARIFARLGLADGGEDGSNLCSREGLSAFFEALDDEAAHKSRLIVWLLWVESG